MAYVSKNPYNNQILKEYSPHDQSYVDQSLDQAEKVFKSEWSSHENIKQRTQVLTKVAENLRKDKEKFAKIMSSEMGKLIEQSRDEVESCAAIAEYFAEHSEKFLQTVPHENPIGEAWVEQHPLGLIVAVEPWNFPFSQLMRVFAPNYAIGNPVLAKHAGIVPQSAEAFEQLILDSGAPKGAWTNLFIDSDQVSEIIKDERVQGVALTGSAKAGRVVAAQAGKYLKKSTLELGGNDVFIVLDEVDLEKAIEIGCQARTLNAGQVCTAAKRFILHEKIADQFKKGLVEAFQKLKTGDPLDETTTLGPLSSEKAVEQLDEQVQKAIQAGAKLVTGGHRIQSDGNFFEPTILEGITPDNEAWFEEFFGPVAQLYVAENDEKILEIANNSHYGLGGVIHSTNIERAKKLASRVETGMVWINWLTDSRPSLPFGGVKNSGYGHELSEIGFKEFVQQKLIAIKS